MANVNETLQQADKDENAAEFNRTLPPVLGDSYIKHIIPNRGWRVHEDYLDILDNGTVNTIALVFLDPGKALDLQPEWGVSFIQDLVDDVLKKNNANNLSVSFINTVHVMDDTWVKRHQTDADRYSDQNTDGHRNQAHVKAQQQDLSLIASEIDGGSSYLATGFKYAISASDLNMLKSFLDSLQRRLDIRIPGTVIALSNGDIDLEYQRLFDDPMHEPGRKAMFTSAEFAGYYNLVTHGIEDPHGVYMGEQQGDINNTAVIWDMTDFEGHAVIATNNRFARQRDYDNGRIDPQFARWSGLDLWVNTLILQLIREKQGRVFTLALDPLNLDHRLDSMTSKLDLNHGAINPFEMFGSIHDEDSIYAANINKWNLMTRQLAQESIKTEGAQQIEEISGTELSDLDAILEEFYIDSKMWVRNPKEDRDDIRIVGIPHESVPRLTKFIAYMEHTYRHYSSGMYSDPVKAQEVNKLLSIYRRLQSVHGDLFDTVTDPIIDTIGTTRHTLFDYSNLSKTKGNILLVQLLNSISAITSQAKDGDTIIIHGAQQIENLTKSYFERIVRDLYSKHVRVVFTYKSIDDMLENGKFNQMSSAAWTLVGHMTSDQIEKYNKLLGNQRHMTDVISTGIQAKNESRYYLRRMQDNIIFDANQLL